MDSPHYDLNNDLKSLDDVDVTYKSNPNQWFIIVRFPSEQESAVLSKLSTADVDVRTTKETTNDGRAKWTIQPKDGRNDTQSGN